MPDRSVHEVAAAPGSGRPPAAPELVAELERVRAREPEALAAFFERHFDRVYGLVYRLLGDRTIAEDMTQEVFMRVFQGLPRFSLRCKFTTWLFQVAKNRVLDELRAIERRPRQVDLDEVALPTLVEPRFEQSEPIEALWAAVAELNIDLRTALLLRDVVGLSYREIADSLEITLATVKWRIHKAREAVQASLEREGFGTATAAQDS